MTASERVLRGTLEQRLAIFAPLRLCVFALVSFPVAWHLVSLSSLFAFSREQEREADTFGFDLMVRAGYDPGEAARIWERLVEEREAADEPETAIFFATHPHTSERIATLKKSAAATRAPRTRDAVNRAQYLAAVMPYRRQWLRDELRLRQPARTEVLLENLSVGGEESGDVHYALGETYRLRGDEGDLDKALAAYQQSIGAADTPPAVYRSLGLVYRRLERSEDAIRALQQYLAVKPDASDRKMIESMIKQAR